MKIILAEQGSRRRVSRVSDIQVPDLWHLAMQLPKGQRAEVLEVWHLAHDLLGALRLIEKGADITQLVQTK